MTIANLTRYAVIGGSAALLSFGLLAPANADDDATRNEDLATVEVVADDDDDDRGFRDDATNTVTNATADASENVNTGASAVTNDNTRSNFTDVSRGDDRSRGDVTRDMTRDGGDLTRDLTADSTNDRTRNDTR